MNSRILSFMALGGGAAVILSWVVVARPEVLQTSEERRVRRTLAQVIDSEELILRYTPRLKKLSKTVGNLTLVDYQSADLFAPKVEVRGLASGSVPATPSDLLASEAYPWPLDPRTRTGAMAKVDPWRPLFDVVDYFEHAKVYFIRGGFEDGAGKRWTAVTGLTALAKGKDGRWLSVHGQQTLLFERDENGTADDEGRQPWHIVSWTQDALDVRSVRERLFAEVSDAALVGPAVREALRGSELEALTVSAVLDPNFEDPYYGFHWISWDQHPSVAVVDIDADGNDDLYVMPHWGENRLLRNHGDRTFEDVTEAHGLAGLRYSTSALFADFDNDGDQDLFVGRWAERSRYFRNDAGRFIPADEAVEVELPKLVTSISAADYDNDGRLDVLFSTYASSLIRREDGFAKSREMPARRLAPYLTDAQSAELYERTRLDHDFKDLAGPPNLLLRNTGDGFGLSAATEDLAIWHNTYQSAWSDFDGDGDQDVYVSNDFAPNDLLRNDGDGTFTNVTEDLHVADIGFGMGASWGDYDGDGRFDLYVTNMYSKAGRRITAGLGTMVDDAFAKMAAGNTLFRNEGPHRPFAHVSGLEAPAMLVEKAGWGWGSQFSDFNNDGHLDIYALSGFYTAPKKIAVDVDL